MLISIIDRACSKIYLRLQHSTHAQHPINYNFSNLNAFVQNYPNTNPPVHAAHNNNNNNKNLGNYFNSTINTNHSISNIPTVKRLVVFIWHPRESFCISVQRGNNENNVNFYKSFKKSASITNADILFKTSKRIFTSEFYKIEKRVAT